MFDFNHFNCSTCDTEDCKLSLLSKDSLNDLEKHSVSMQIVSGEYLFRQGAPLNSIIHLRKGHVKSYIENTGEKKLILNIHKPGSLFGIKSALTSFTYNYSGMAIEDSIICFINPDRFLQILKSDANFCFEILKMISQESLSLNEKLKVHMKALLPGRVASTLLHLSNNIYESDTFYFPFSITELSQLVGASRERISKIINEFKKDKLIGFDNKVLSILDHKHIEQLIHLG